MNTGSIPKHKVPWNMVRNRCAVCTGWHAPWWRYGQAPSCRQDNPRVNDVTMFLEASKALSE